MKITKLQENKELAELTADRGSEAYEKALNISDEDSQEIIKNNEEIKAKQEKEKADKSERDNYNRDSKSPEIKNLNDVKQYFDKPTFESNKKLQKAGMKALTDVYTNVMKLPQAGKVINRYEPNFIKSWTNSFNWQAVGDKSEPFVQALNNSNLDSILNGNESSWVKLYNILYDADNGEYAEYVKAPKTLICNSNLYKSDISPREAKQIVKIDLADGGKHRTGFNKRLDRNAWGEILNFGKEKLNLKDDSSDKLINVIKNNEKNLSSEEKIKAGKALKFKKDELKKLSDELENANIN